MLDFYLYYACAEWYMWYNKCDNEIHLQNNDMEKPSSPAPHAIRDQKPKYHLEWPYLDPGEIGPGGTSLILQSNVSTVNSRRFSIQNKIHKSTFVV